MLALRNVMTRSSLTEDKASPTDARHNGLTVLKARQKNAAREGGIKTVTSLMRRNHDREPDILCMVSGAWRAPHNKDKHSHLSGQA